MWVVCSHKLNFINLNLIVNTFGIEFPIINFSSHVTDKLQLVLVSICKRYSYFEAPIDLIWLSLPCHCPIIKSCILLQIRKLENSEKWMWRLHYSIPKNTNIWNILDKIYKDIIHLCCSKSFMYIESPDSRNDKPPV